MWGQAWYHNENCAEWTGNCCWKLLLLMLSFKLIVSRLCLRPSIALSLDTITAATMAIYISYPVPYPIYPILVSIMAGARFSTASKCVSQVVLLLLGSSG